MHDEPPADFKPLDPGRVNTMDPVEVRYWCRQLHCTRPQLQAAVARVGDHVAEVRTALGAHGPR